MLQHTARLAEVVTVQELSERDLEKIGAGKDGNYRLIGIYTGYEAMERARRNPSPEITPHGHIK
jgi:hypothetical protein